jgi:hypothetical protein
LRAASNVYGRDRSGERNLTIQTVLTVAKGLGMTMSELLSGIEKQVESSKQLNAKK